MTFESGSYHGLRYITEATWGTTPSTPAMIDLRHTECNLGVTKDTFQSMELRTDRQIPDIIHGAIKVANGFSFEFSYSEFDAMLESALYGAWNTNVLKAGVTPKSFTFERAYAGIGKYSVFTGCQATTFSLSVPVNDKVTGAFSFIGKNAAAMTGTPLDASTTASQTNDVFTGHTMGAIKEGGSTIATVTSIELALENSIDPAFVLGSNVAAAVTPGRSNLTGTVSAWFENETLFNKFINETSSSIEFTLGNGTTKSYTFLIPNIKYTGGGDINVSGEGRIALSMPFQALRATSEATQLQITRIPGA